MENPGSGFRLRTEVNPVNVEIENLYVNFENRNTTKDGNTTFTSHKSQNAALT